jgi:hypothetical protein
VVSTSRATLGKGCAGRLARIACVARRQQSLNTAATCPSRRPRTEAQFPKSSRSSKLSLTVTGTLGSEETEETYQSRPVAGFQERLDFDNGHAPDPDSVLPYLKNRIPSCTRAGARRGLPSACSFRDRC